MRVRRFLCIDIQEHWNCTCTRLSLTLCGWARMRAQVWIAIELFPYSERNIHFNTFISFKNLELYTRGTQSSAFWSVSPIVSIMQYFPNPSCISLIQASHLTNQYRHIPPASNAILLAYEFCALFGVQDLFLISSSPILHLSHALSSTGPWQFLSFSLFLRTMGICIVPDSGDIDNWDAGTVEGRCRM